MKENTECGFNEDQERYSTFCLIEYGDACCKIKINAHGSDLSDFGAWSDRYNVSTTNKKSSQDLSKLLEISIDQRKEGHGTRRIVESKYCTNPKVYIDPNKWIRPRCINRSKQSQGVYSHPESCLPSRPTGQKSDNESAIGDKREKIMLEENEEMKRSSNKYPMKPCSG